MRLLKKIPVLLIFLISFNALSQTYYNPKNSIEITITKKEPYKPVDYYGITKDLSRGVSSEMARREELKRYYDQIIFETKNSIQQNQILTNDYQIDKLILNLNEVTFQYLDKLNKSLKSGLLNPSDYEFNVKNIYYEHINSNRTLVELMKYKYQKELLLNNEEEIQVFRKKFESRLDKVEGFTIDKDDNYFFNTPEYYSKPKKLSNILDFVIVLIK